MSKRKQRLVNLRWYCDLTIEGARLQRERVLRGYSTRHDVDFYVLAVWRLLELARQADTNGVEGAGEIRNEMLQRWPLLSEVRNWWTHARDMERTTWFSDGVYRLQSDGSALAVMDVEHDHAELEAFYERLSAALPQLPKGHDSG